MQKQSIFTRLWTWFISEFKQVPTIENSIVKFADKVTDELKTLDADGILDFLEKGIVAIATAVDPALVPLISGLENYIPKLISLVTGVIDSESTKPIHEQLADGLAALQGIKDQDTIVYAGNLGTVNAAISNYVISNNATELDFPLPEPAQLLSAGQAIHAHGFDDVQVAAENMNFDENKANQFAGATDPDMQIVNETRDSLAGNVQPADMGASAFKDKVAQRSADAVAASKAEHLANLETPETEDGAPATDPVV